MRFLLATLGLAIALAAAAIGHEASAQSGAPITIETTEVRPHFHLLRGSSGGNVLVCDGADGLVVVDAQYARARDSVWAAIRSFAPASTSVRDLVDTHWHRDHAEGNPSFPGAGAIVAHAATRARLATPQSLFGRAIAPLPEAALPSVTFTDSLTLFVDGDSVRLVHFGPAHTDGDIAVFFERARVAHLGDLFLPGRFPFVDLDHGGSVQGMSGAVAAALARMDPSWRIVPGHGAVADIAALAAYHAMLRTSIDVVGEGIRRGDSLARIEQRGLPASLAGWAWQANPESLWIRTVYTSLRAPRDGSH